MIGNMLRLRRLRLRGVACPDLGPVSGPHDCLVRRVGLQPSDTLGERMWPLRQLVPALLMGLLRLP